MTSMKQSPDSKNGFWNLFLLGYSNEKIRKALIINYLTKEELQARVSESKEKGKTTYTVIEAVDPKTNSFVEFAKTFTVAQR